MEERYLRRENESEFDYKVRICLAKLNKEIELKWNEIVDLLGLDCSGDHLRKLSYGWKEMLDSNKEGHNRILCISDIHIPFNLPIDILKEYINKVDTLIINGDLLDTYSLSKFTKMYRQPLIDELIKAREYIITLVDMIKPKRLIAITGNHEMRLGKAIADKIGTDLLDLMPTDTMAFLFDTGFNQYDHKDKTKTIYEPLKDVLDCEVIYANNFWYKEGKSIFVHPLSFRQSILGTTEKALAYFQSIENDFDTVCMAHTHMLGYAKYGKYHLYEQGCLCDLKHMKYMDMKLPKKPATNGFIYLIQDEDGNLIYDKCVLKSL